VIAIVGGGCAGALVARAVLRDPNWRTVLISPEPEPEAGRGVAYGAAEPWHVLNSRAAAMSVESGDPLHLVRWCRAHGTPIAPTDFLPRARYGDYLADQFAEAAAAAGDRLRHRAASATEVRPDGAGYLVCDDSGAETRADHVVLAVGSLPPHRPAGVSDTAYRSAEFVADPWARGALGAVPTDEPVLLLGTGLTAVDVALTLTVGGRRAPVEALSRRGLLPLAHPGLPAPAVPLGLPSGRDLRPLLRRLREAAAAGIDWTAIVDDVRVHADRLWAGLDTAAQERFLRHAARFWEVHRHRMAPPVAARVADLRRQGVLRVRAGRLKSIVPHSRGGLTVHVDGEEPRRYGAVITCTGPGSFPGAAPPPLAGMLADGRLRPGPHALGADADADGRLLDARGRVQPGLWLVGPLRRGRLWEATAVPEIRAQVDRLVAALPAPVSSSG
jgi:uncharacterized NAD(P)/FAD-binding protein YdhS